MPSVTSPYPPPLSSPPTVETLERLLMGLERPEERVAPRSAVVDLSDDVLFEEGPTEAARRPTEVPATAGTAATASGPRPVSAPDLTWSAHPGRSRRLRVGAPTAAVAVTTAALAAAAAAGLGLL